MRCHDPLQGNHSASAWNGDKASTQLMAEGYEDCASDPDCLTVAGSKGSNQW